MNKTQYPKLDETVYSQVLACGLTVLVVPRQGFTRKMAYYVTDFGSIHTEFSFEGTHHSVPAGIAHFLEHKMFELPERDVTAEFAAFGAGVNAFTSYDMTAYYFSCTENFEESLRLLIEFVSTPYFPEDSVAREVGIIDQEIGMNDDSPDTRVFENLMLAMYRSHPIRVPILGTRESIRQIRPEMLEACHRAFYNPANMVLCVVGDVDPERVARIAESVLGTERRETGIKEKQWREDMSCREAAVENAMEVAMPNFQLAFKCEPLDHGAAAIRAEAVGDLAAETLFGESSSLYLKLYEEGLIDSSFGGGFETVDGCALLTCGGDSEEPEAVKEAILAQVETILETGIPEEDFLRMKRSAFGRRVRDLDSFDSTCFRMCAYHFSGFDYFRFPEIYEQISAGEVLEFLKRTVTESRASLSVIRPLTDREQDETDM